jgi:hypothetical protein
MVKFIYSEVVTKPMKALTGLLIIATLALVVPIMAVRAASMSDAPSQSIGQTSSSNNNSAIGNNGFNNISSNSNDNQKLSPTGSTEAATNDTVANTLVLTATPDKPSVKIGSDEIIHVKAAMANGTGIPDATIKAIIIDYVTSHEKVMLGGKTDAKGALDLTANIGSHAKAGQFLAQVNGTKGDLHKSISTGFVVTDGGSSSGSSGGGSGTKGKCSGSSCR